MPDTYGFPLYTFRHPSRDCQLPCWHGITPGFTTYNQVRSILDADPNLTFDYTDNLGSSLNLKYTYLSFVSNYYVEILFDAYQSVSSITLNGADRVSRVLSLFGMPTSISANKLCRLTLSFANSQTFAVSIWSDHFDLPRLKRFPHISIGIESLSFSAEAGPPNFHNYDPVHEKWRGFTSRYFRPIVQCN